MPREVDEGAEGGICLVLSVLFTMSDGFRVMEHHLFERLQQSVESGIYSSLQTWDAFLLKALNEVAQEDNILSPRHESSSSMGVCV